MDGLDEKQSDLEQEKLEKQKQMGLERRNVLKMAELLHPDPQTEGKRRFSQSKRASKDDCDEKTRCEDDLSPLPAASMNLDSLLQQYSNNLGELSLPTKNVCDEDGRKAKKTFLKRGEGIKQRFKIDPNAFRIGNLPSYKFAKTKRYKANISKRKDTKETTQRNTQQQAGNSQNNNEEVETLEPPVPNFDIHEKRFQSLLFNSKLTMHSTPESIKSSDTGLGLTASSSVVDKPKHVGHENKETGNKHQQPTIAEMPRQDLEQVISSAKSSDTMVSMFSGLSTSSERSMGRILWSQVLDPFQIKPLPLETIRHRQECLQAISEDDNDHSLSIFELLETKTREGSIDMNASCIQKLIRKQSLLRALKSLEDNDEIPVRDELTQAPLRPIVIETQILDTSASTTTADEESEIEELQLGEETADSGEVTAKSFYQPEEVEDKAETIESAASSPPRKHVRFLNEGSALANESELTLTESKVDEKLFQEFKVALYQALSDKVPPNTDAVYESRHDEEPKKVEEPNSGKKAAQAEPPANHNEDLQTKTALLKNRMIELEHEIAGFKEKNKQLLKAKQLHEAERAQFAQEQLDALERLKDEKVQMEIYLHDERIKIEEERIKMAQQLQAQKAATLNKERKEMAQLKENLVNMEQQLKQKEQQHAAAQARMRTQVRGLEKEQKQLYAEIEQLKKENKKLEQQMIQMRRESNNKMLHEINRNIERLAPKLTLLNDENKPKAIESDARNRSNEKKKSQKVTTTVRQKDKAVNVKPPKYSPESTDSESNDTSDDETPRRTRKSESLPTSKSTQSKTLKDSEKLMQQFDEKNKKADEENDQSNSSASNDNSKSEQSFKREIINDDGSKDIWYPNGNVKKISGDGMVTRMLYFNKDIKETDVNKGTVKYYYADTNTWHTSYLDGHEVLEYPNGQTEHRYKNGVVETHYPDKSIKVVDPKDKQNREEWRFQDGTKVFWLRNGDKILLMPDGQKEIQTKLHKRREYPDGTVKIVYHDGSQETRYSNGRVRLKDKAGNLVMDSATTHVA